MVKPIFKSVTKNEFDEFLESYPRHLSCDVFGACDPPLLSYNDFELADKWPGSVVASTYCYDDTPGGYFYKPEDERSYSIMINHEDVYNDIKGE